MRSLAAAPPLVGLERALEPPHEHLLVHPLDDGHRFELGVAPLPPVEDEHAARRRARQLHGHPLRRRLQDGGGLQGGQHCPDEGREGGIWIQGSGGEE